MVLETEMDIDDNAFIVYKGDVFQVKIIGIEIRVDKHASADFLYKTLLYFKNDPAPKYFTFPKKEIFNTKMEAVCYWLEKQEVEPREALHGYFEHVKNENIKETK